MDRVQARLEHRKGNTSYLRHDFMDAIRHYDAALRHAPDSAPIHLARAYAYVSLFRAATDPAERRRLAGEAIRSFQTYLDLRAKRPADAKSNEPSRDRIEQTIVTLYLDSQQTDAALRYLTARVERDPKDVPTLQMLATIEAERANLDAALGWYRKRVEAEPRSPEARHALAAFIWQTSYRNPTMDPLKRNALLDEALADLKEALALRPDYFDALVYVNLLYRQKAQYSTSDAEREAFMQQARDYFARAETLRKSGAAAGGPVDSTGAAAGASVGDSAAAGGLRRAPRP